MVEIIDLKSIQCEFESHLPYKLLNKILSKCIIKNQCLIWIGAITKSTGYGKIKYLGKAYDVHRLVGSYLFGNLNRKDEICHFNKCEFRNCIRPSHIYKGTRSTNMLDASEKGTLHKPIYDRYK